MSKRFDMGKMIAATGNEYVTAAGDPKGITDEYISTGSYALNALICGSIFGGIPNNKSVMFAGIESVGKSLFTGFICNSAMNMGYKPFYFETEGATDENTFKGFKKTKGVDYAILPIKTIDDLRLQAYQIIDMYKAYYNSLSAEEYLKRQKILMVVDSIGMLGSTANIKNLAKGEIKRDLTKQQALRELFRDITVDLNILKIPLIPVNHVYETIDPYGEKFKVSGGGGGRYGASSIITLSKTKVKDSTKKFQLGVIIKAKAPKSRFIQENKEVEVYLDFKKGLDPFYGLNKFLADETILAKTKNKEVSEYYLIYRGKNESGEYDTVKGNPFKDKQIRDEILPLIDEKVKEDFCFGSSGLGNEDDEDYLDDVEVETTEEVE